VGGKVSSGKKRGLGRGLDALIPKGEEEAAAPREVALSLLAPNQLQPRTRFDDEELASLAASIRAQGLLQPLVVMPGDGGRYQIIAGERRWRAAGLAGLTHVPVVVRRNVSERERLELALVENLQRSDLDPIEEAEAFQGLQDRFGLSQEEVAARVGKSRVAVTNALRLLRLPGEIRDLLRNRQLTAGQARPLLGVTEPGRQLELAQRAVREQLSARQLERLATTAVPSTRLPKPAEVHAAAAAETLTRHLQTRVEIRRTGKGGHLRIHFHSEPELIRLYDRLMGREDHER
jgi:ParB family chromosome partitioning protein